MCPLRVILIFLSATLAGFFLLRNLKSQPKIPQEEEEEDHHSRDSLIPLSDSSSFESNTFFSKVWAAIGTGFWTCVDMASGRYLWRNLVSSSSKPSS